MYEVAVVRGAGKGKVMWSGPEIIVNRFGHEEVHAVRDYNCRNSLPQTVLSSDSVAVFKLRLKTFLFSQAFSSFSAH